MAVLEVHSLAEYNAAVNGAGDKLVVCDFSAAWCGPCKMIAPLYAQLAGQYPNVVFLKVDVDEAKVCSSVIFIGGIRLTAFQDIARACGISAMPTFWFLRRSTRLEFFSGADAAKLEATIRRLAAAPAPTPAPAGAADLADKLDIPGGHKELTEYVQVPQAACLNQHKDHPIRNIFQREGYLESDCDEQLLLFIPFNQTVKIHSIKIDAPDNGHGPKSLKLFVDQPNLDFGNAESLAAVQDINLSADELKKVIPLKFVKFQKVNSLTVFVKSNQGGRPTTIIDRLRFIGQPLQTTNMKDFTRVAGKAGESDGVPGMPNVPRDPRPN